MQIANCKQLLCIVYCIIISSGPFLKMANASYLVCSASVLADSLKFNELYYFKIKNDEVLKVCNYILMEAFCNRAPASDTSDTHSIGKTRLTKATMEMDIVTQKRRGDLKSSTAEGRKYQRIENYLVRSQNDIFLLRI